MPIQHNPTVIFNLVAIDVDVRTMVGKVKYLRLEDGAQIGGELEFDIVGAQLGAIMQASPNPAGTRLDDIADAINAHVVAQGLLRGKVV